MAFAQRTEITVPVMTPTSAAHPELPSPTSQQAPYSSSHENFATSVLLSGQSTASDLASQQTPAADAEATKLEAQALLDAQKPTSRKAFKAYLDEEIASLTREVDVRVAKREEALRVNQGVEDEVKKLEARYETERRALGKRLQGLGK